MKSNDHLACAFHINFSLDGMAEVGPFADCLLSAGESGQLPFSVARTFVRPVRQILDKLV